MGTRFPNLGRLRSPASPGRARKPLKRRRARRGTPIAARGGGRLDESRAKQYVRCPPPGDGGPGGALPPFRFFLPSEYTNIGRPPSTDCRVVGQDSEVVAISTTPDAHGRPT